MPPLHETSDCAMIAGAGTPIQQYLSTKLYFVTQMQASHSYLTTQLHLERILKMILLYSHY